jgi:hypothetical protein
MKSSKVDPVVFPTFHHVNENLKTTNIMVKTVLLSLILILIACSQNKIDNEEISQDITEKENNSDIINDINDKKNEKTKEIENGETDLNSSQNSQISSSEITKLEKKENKANSEKGNSKNEKIISLKDIPNFYFKTREIADGKYYNPCKNKEGEYIFVLYIKDNENKGTLDFYDGRQKYILHYEAVTKFEDNYIFHTKPIAAFSNKPMNVQLHLVGEDLIVTFVNKETGSTLDKQTFVSENGIQKYKANDCF